MVARVPVVAVRRMCVRSTTVRHTLTLLLLHVTPAAWVPADVERANVVVDVASASGAPILHPIRNLLVVRVVLHFLGPLTLWL